MSPLILLTAGVILVFTPLSVLATVFLWRLARKPEDRDAAIAEIVMATQETNVVAVRLYEAGLRVVGQGNQFGELLATMSITRTIAAVLLAIPTLYYIAGTPAPFSGQLILVAIDILLPTGVGVAAYLWWLRR